MKEKRSRRKLNEKKKDERKDRIKITSTLIEI